MIKLLTTLHHFIIATKQHAQTLLWVGPKISYFWIAYEMFKNNFHVNHEDIQIHRVQLIFWNYNSNLMDGPIHSTNLGDGPMECPIRVWLQIIPYIFFIFLAKH